MTQVSIHEAKTHLSRLIEKVLRGEEVVIAKRHRPVVRLVMEQPEKRDQALGALRGLVVRESSDCWEAEDYEESASDPLSGTPTLLKAVKSGKTRKAR
jgi:prevent-host-death family protein